MSRSGAPRPGDLDAILRDDLAIDSIAHGRRPRGADSALDLLSALGEDVEMRVPRRRHRRSRRYGRGLIVTTVAATMLGATGVAAAEPGDATWGAFQLWTSQEDSPAKLGPHSRAASASLSAAERSLGEGNAQGAATSLRAATAQLNKAPSGMKTRRLREHATKLHTQLYGPSHQANGPGSLHPVPTQPQPSSPPAQAGGRPSLWNWLWGIPSGGPDWQPPKDRPDNSPCSARSCGTAEPATPDSPETTAPEPEPEPTHGQDNPSLLRRLFGTPDTASPSSSEEQTPSPSGSESSTSTPTPTTSPSESPSDDTDTLVPSPSGGSSGSGHSDSGQTTSPSGPSPTPDD